MASHQGPIPGLLNAESLVGLQGVSGQQRLAGELAPIINEPGVVDAQFLEEQPAATVPDPAGDRSG
jgi:hypothetical protein